MYVYGIRTLSGAHNYDPPTIPIQTYSPPLSQTQKWDPTLDSLDEPTDQQHPFHLNSTTSISEGANSS